MTKNVIRITLLLYLAIMSAIAAYSTGGDTDARIPIAMAALAILAIFFRRLWIVVVLIYFLAGLYLSALLLIVCLVFSNFAVTAFYLLALLILLGGPCAALAACSRNNRGYRSLSACKTPTPDNKRVDSLRDESRY